MKHSNRKARTNHPVPLTLLAAAFWALGGAAAQAQTAPDAGRLLQEQGKVPALPKPASSISIASPAKAKIAGGGEQVELRSVSFSGNTRYSQAQLQALLAGAMGKRHDLAALRDLANQVSEFYHAGGYPFASAYLPVQPMQDGALQIAVVEGKYGTVTAQTDDAAIASAAQRFLAALRPGDVIQSDALMRATLLLDDLPGYKVSPIVRPGQEVGTGDLDVKIERTERYSADLGVDNQGNRYTGRNRLRANLDLNSPFMLGDQVSLHGVFTGQGMWMGSLGYGLPLGNSGLRGTASYAHTAYELGGSFAANQSSGIGDVLGVGFSFPLQRSQKANLTLAGNWQHKKLNDRNGLANTSADKTVTAQPLALNFDARDNLGLGGLTYGSFSWTPGQLKLDSSLLGNDQQAQMNGHFNKVNLDVVRLQSLGASLSLMGRLSAQYASKNLDSSEDFGLGGANGVRAYPTGEAFGDAGWLCQIELRYATGAYAPYAFYDAGSIKTNANPWAGAGANGRTLGGAGLGLRYQRGNWSLESTLAWRTSGGTPQADTSASKGPQAWLNLVRKF